MNVKSCIPSIEKRIILSRRGWTIKPSYFPKGLNFTFIYQIIDLLDKTNSLYPKAIETFFTKGSTISYSTTRIVHIFLSLVKRLKMKY